MNIDLQRVLARKQERECARLDDFAFRARARAMGLLAAWLRERGHDADPRSLAAAIATESDAAIVERLIEAHGIERQELLRAFRRAQARAKRDLAAELGDPNPHRLA